MIPSDVAADDRRRPIGLLDHLKAEQGGLAELESEHDRAAGGGADTSSGAPGGGGVEVVAVDGGGLLQGEALVGIPVFVLEFDAD
ncbi:MAG: hypothetical protein F4X83_06330 [Chloroflexi bacterium]|nr:hypothetical protein [Chloroflexota bacterium]